MAGSGREPDGSERRTAWRCWRGTIWNDGARHSDVIRLVGVEIVQRQEVRLLRASHELKRVLADLRRLEPTADRHARPVVRQDPVEKISDAGAANAGFLRRHELIEATRESGLAAEERVRENRGRLVSMRAKLLREVRIARLKAGRGIDGQSPPVFPAEDGEVRRNRPGRRCPGVVECRRSSGEARQMRHRRMRTESIAGAHRVEKNENDVALRA